MAGKFINTNRAGKITQGIMSDNINNLSKKIVNNPYYAYSDKKAVKCTYYNLNTTKTTLDEATKGNFGEISPEDPKRYNKISDFLIYGVNRIDLNLEVGEFGLEASDITDDAVVIPYTITPYPGDYIIFTDSVRKPLLFRVSSVNPNSLDTGAILYKINFTLVASDQLKDIESQVVKKYKFIAKNIGTNFASLMEEDFLEEIKKMESYSTLLKDYFISLFFDNKIQSFSYTASRDTIGGSSKNNYGYKDFIGFKVYDSYLIEFIIRNNLLKGSSTYIYISHAMETHRTFGMDYNKTFFYTLENKDLKHIGSFIGNLLLCDQKLSLLYQYPIDYYFMEYLRLRDGLFLINIFDDLSFGENLKNNRLYGEEFKYGPLFNLIISYMNNKPILLEELESIKNMDYLDNRMVFYLLPMVIYCIDKQIESSINKNNSNNLLIGGK